MTCQQFTGTYSTGNNYVGIDLQVVTASAAIQAQGYPLMLVASFWPDGFDGEGYGVRGDDAYVISDLSPDDLRCGDPANRHDCLNGRCIPRTTYNTPGKYRTLAACVGGCAKESPCDGECVSEAEITALQQAANNLKAKFCKQSAPANPSPPPQYYN